MPQAKNCALEVTQTMPGKVIRLRFGIYKVSTDLIPPDVAYQQMLSYRPSALETVQYALQRERELGRKKRRNVLKDKLFQPYFDSSIDSFNSKHERTGAFLRAPKGKRRIGAYIDKKGNKRYARGVQFGIYDKVISDDVRLPLTYGGKIVEWNELGLPAEISEGREPHVWHLLVDEDKKEVGVVFGGGMYDGEDGWCLHFNAGWGRSHSDEDAAFRLVHGSVEDYEYPTL